MMSRSSGLDHSTLVRDLARALAAVAVRRSLDQEGHEVLRRQRQAVRDFRRAEAQRVREERAAEERSRGAQRETRDRASAAAAGAERELTGVRAALDSARRALGQEGWGHMLAHIDDGASAATGGDPLAELKRCALAARRAQAHIVEDLAALRYWRDATARPRLGWAFGALLAFWIVGGYLLGLRATALLTPLVAAALTEALKLEHVVQAMDTFGRWAAAAGERNRQGTQWYHRYVYRPLYWGLRSIREQTEAIEERHVRAGVRAAAYAYYGGGLLFLVFGAGGGLLAIAAALAVIVAVLWAIGAALSR